jgi:hypothetical protein
MTSNVKQINLISKFNIIFFFYLPAAIAIFCHAHDKNARDIIAFLCDAGHGKKNAQYRIEQKCDTRRTKKYSD